MHGRKGIILGLLFLWGLPAEAQTPVVQVQPGTQQINGSSLATIHVVINGVQALHAFSVRIAYDPLLLRCTAVHDKYFLGSSALFFPGVDSVAGEVRADAAILGPGGVSGTGELLEVVFEGVQTGSASLHFTTVDLRDTANKSIAVQTQDGEIRVGSVNGIAAMDNGGASMLQAVSYPNPFNSSTTLILRAGDGTAVMSVYSLLGVEVLHREVSSRRGVASTVVWDGRDRSGRAVGSGVYLFRVSMAGSSACTRIMLLK
jgi:hypothetical protein